LKHLLLILGNSMNTGIILVHGFTGSSHDLKPLAEKLINIYDNDSVKNINLPGHDNEGVPEFDEDGFIESIWKEISLFRNENRKIVIICHSTGGNMVLSCMHKNKIYPDMLILAGVPFRVDSDTYMRWNNHREGKSTVPFSSIAKMVSMINRTGRAEYLTDHMHALIIAGEEDQLVLSEDAGFWKEKFHKVLTRLVIAPETGHDIFNSSGSSFIFDLILRAINDINNDCEMDVSGLVKVEPEVSDFIISSPFSVKHLSYCPSVKMLTCPHIELEPEPVNDPVFANIEITTRCNFRCKYCARGNIHKDGMDMEIETFRRILDLLPHAYRITIVGLGEPLLHPRITEFIEIAKSLKRRVGLVTNASLLDSVMSKELISAGLDLIAFSLDTVSQDLANCVRKGTDVDQVIDNIRQFIRIANAARPIAKAVFTALSLETIPGFNDLIETVSTLGVDIMMLTDLNFTSNVKDTIWKTVDNEMVVHIRNGIKNAFKKNLPILSVHALEEFGLRSRYRDFLLLPPDQLFHRAETRKHCYSPWQTVPIDVEGNITMCDCQPENRVGNMLIEPFTTIWRGVLMGDYRTRMIGENPPDPCRICPRF
jgi:MoaA/NifB/PqqE/SkfB family radical SAM enzyme/esterase/lipase